MTIYASRLVHRELVAHETLACVLERPDGFTFRAGQYVDVTLPEPLYDDLLGPTRSFSVASAPGERDLLLLMRMRNTAFKRSFAEMRVGTSVLIDGPADDLTITLEDGHPAVLLAGGVGIAPFLGALRAAASHGAPVDATLFYSNRRPEDAAYLGELVELAESISGFRFIPTMTRMQRSAVRWEGETERVGAPLLSRYLPALRGPRYYLSGSTLFISGVRQALTRAGAPGLDIRIELYTGY